MNKTLAGLAALATLAALTACTSSADPAPPAQSNTSAPEATPAPSSTTAPSSTDTPVTITAGDQTFSATINDSQVSKDFLAILPTTLSWERNAGIEYISELSEPLTEIGPFYTGVEAGDIVYYNPRDSITIIYAPTSSVPTLTKMGRVTSDLAAFESLPDSVDMRIDLQ